MTNERDRLMASRNAYYSGSDRDLLLDIGFFVSRFSLAEMAVTALLGVLIGQRDFTLTETIFARATAGQKAKKLKSLAKLQGGIGPIFQQWFDKFERKAIPLRNKISHTTLAIDENAGFPTYLSSTIGSLPWVHFEMDFEGAANAPEVIEGLELYACGLWLETFSRQAMAAGKQFVATGTLDIPASVPVSQDDQEN